MMKDFMKDMRRSFRWVVAILSAIVIVSMMLFGVSKIKSYGEVITYPVHAVDEVLVEPFDNISTMPEKAPESVPEKTFKVEDVPPTYDEEPPQMASEDLDTALVQLAIDTVTMKDIGPGSGGALPEEVEVIEVSPTFWQRFRAWGRKPKDDVAIEDCVYITPTVYLVPLGNTDIIISEKAIAFFDPDVKHVTLSLCPRKDGETLFIVSCDEEITDVLAKK